MITKNAENCKKKNAAPLKKGHACIRDNEIHTNENERVSLQFPDNFELRPYQIQCIESPSKTQR